MKALFWIPVEQLTDKIVLTPSLAKKYPDRDIKSFEPNLHGFDQKIADKKTINFLSWQGAAAAFLAVCASITGETKVMMTGVANLTRNAQWFATHKVIKGWENIRTLNAKVLTDLYKAKAYLSPTEQNKHKTDVFERILHQRRYHVRQSAFKFLHKNHTHTIANGVFAGLAAFVHIPQMLEGLQHAMRDGHSFLNGHFLGGGIAILGYIGLSLGYFDKNIELNKARKDIMDGAVPYDPVEGYKLKTYGEKGLHAKNIMYEWAPPVCFVAKGAFYCMEAAHLAGLTLTNAFNAQTYQALENPIAAGLLLASGLVFAKSGADEFKHLNGYKITQAFDRAIQKLSAELHLTHLQASFRGAKNDIKRTFGLQTKIYKPTKPKNNDLNDDLNNAAPT